MDRKSRRRAQYAASPEKYRAAASSYRKAHPDRVKASKLARRLANPGREKMARRAQRLLREYGLTLVQFQTMFEGQQGVCKICNSSFLGERDTQVDHCHKTGRVRGILCGHCNTALGKFKDSPEIMQKAIEYVKNI